MLAARVGTSSNLPDSAQNDVRNSLARPLDRDTLAALLSPSKVRAHTRTPLCSDGKIR